MTYLSCQRCNLAMQVGAAYLALGDSGCPPLRPGTRRSPRNVRYVPTRASPRGLLRPPR